MNKKYLAVSIMVLCLVIGGATYFPFFKMVSISTTKEQVPPLDDQFHYVPKWNTYHNDKYGFSVSYLDYQKITAQAENNSSIYTHYQWTEVRKNGIYFVGFSDGDMWESVVTVYETDLKLKEFVAKMLEAEKMENDKYVSKKIDSGYLVTVIDSETSVSGHSAVLYHGYIKGTKEHIAERHLLVKINRGIVDFNTRMGEPYYNTYFIQSVRFEQ